MSYKTGKEEFTISAVQVVIVLYVHTLHIPFEITVTTEKFTNPIETGYILLVTLEVVDAEQ